MPQIPRLPPRPTGVATRAWAPADRRLRVQSDTRHAAAWTRALRAGAPTTALLVSDPTSAHHPFDVAVYVADEYVGDL